MTRAKAQADADVRRGERRPSRERARRTFAAARLQVCANVFASSRIHFEPELQVVRLPDAIDRRARACGAASNLRPVFGERPGAAAQSDDKITIH